MDELLICTGAILVTVGAAYWFILSMLKYNRDIANKKFDAIEKTLLNMKYR